MKHQSYSIVAINKGSMIKFSLEEHLEILVRLVLHRFGQDPEHFNLKDYALEKAHEPGLMEVGPQYLMTPELCKIMSKNKSIKTTLRNIGNHLKTKIQEKCAFTSNFLRKMMTSEFQENLRKCLDLDLPLRLYQMENMVDRSEDGYIIMDSSSVASSRDKQRTFVKESAKKYTYKYNESNTSTYVFSYFEAICYQCGFFTWEDISKYLIVFIRLSF